MNTEVAYHKYVYNNIHNSIFMTRENEKMYKCACLIIGQDTNHTYILKSKDISLPTKVHIVKAIFSSLVMYGCESCIIKKAEHLNLHWKDTCF